MAAPIRSPTSALEPCARDVRAGRTGQPDEQRRPDYQGGQGCRHRRQGARRDKWMVPMICSFRERLRSRGANTYAPVGLYAYKCVGATPVTKGSRPLEIRLRLRGD